MMNSVVLLVAAGVLGFAIGRVRSLAAFKGR